MPNQLPSPIKRAFRQLIPQDRQRPASVADYRYVFIVTYGRSGSTLLMSLLNTIPGYRILGENYNALYHVYRAVSAIRSGRERWSNDTHRRPQSGWYGMPDVRPDRFERDLLDSFVANVLRPQPGDRVLGFKEIRHTDWHIKDKDLAEYLAYVRQAFPGCKIIFNHRDPAAVARSGWWAKMRTPLKNAQAADDLLWSFPADEHHFHFSYDKLDERLDNVRELFVFLGEELDEAAVRGVLNTPHSPPPGGGVPAQAAAPEPAERVAEAG